MTCLHLEMRPKNSTTETKVRCGAAFQGGLIVEYVVVVELTSVGSHAKPQSRRTEKAQ